MNKIIYIVLILVLFTGCFSKPVNIIIQNKIYKEDIAFKIYNSRVSNDKIYFDLEFINKSKQDKVLIITLNTFNIKDDKGYFYPVYIDEFLANKTSRELYIRQGKSRKLSFYSLKKIKDNKIHSAILTIKNNIISNIPLLHKKYEEQINDINHIWISYTSFNGKSYLDAIGYTVECKNNKEFYVESHIKDKITVYDRQKKKSILEFKKSEIDKYISKICTY